MSKMNSDVKAKWISALRSGEYKKIEGALAKKDDDGDMCFCALGVLCDLHTKVSGQSWTQDFHAHMYMGRDDLLPGAVRKWAGLESENPVIYERDGEKLAVADMNDGEISKPSSFERIADLIEKNL